MRSQVYHARKSRDASPRPRLPRREGKVISSERWSLDAFVRHWWRSF
jgi:hypothetical protein